MKKKFIVISVFSLAIGLSAFTVRHHSPSAKLDNLFWYSYDQGQLTGFIEQASQADLMLDTDCKNQHTPICAKGYSTSQGTSFPITAPGGAVDVLKRNP